MEEQSLSVLTQFGAAGTLAGAVIGFLWRRCNAAEKERREIGKEFRDYMREDNKQLLQAVQMMPPPHVARPLHHEPSRERDREI